MSCRTETARAPGLAASHEPDATGRARPDANGRGRLAGAFEVDGVYRLCWNSNCLWLAGAERDDAPDRIVRRNAYRYAIARNDFNTEAAHSAAELGQHFMAGVTLHAVKPSAMHGYDGALHVDQIVLAQIASIPFKQQLCHRRRWIGQFGELMMR